MKKIILIIFFIIIFLILIYSNSIINNILLSFNICFKNLFPSLIPFLFLSNILINYNYIEELSNIFEFITIRLFKINKYSAFAIIMSMISGSPSNSKYLKDLYDNSLINENDIKKCLNFCHYTNPLFLINVLGFTFLTNKKNGLIILISQLLSSLIIALLFKNNNSKITSIKYNKGNTNNKKFINVLNDSITSTANTLLLILGVITFCLIITSLIDSLFKIDNNYKFIYGLLEITQGLKYLSISNLNIYIKCIIASFIVSFGGFCIHIQVFSILDNKKIRYIPYLFSRLLHGLVSAIITSIIILFH